MFSVLMSNYNTAGFVEDAIQSVLNQTYQDWELIIVDDCSTDNSVEVINRSAEDKRIKLLQLPKNSGFGVALGMAAENACGTICGILDSDDALTKDALATMVQAHNEYPDCGYIYSQYTGCDINMKPLSLPSGQRLPGKTTYLQILENPALPNLRVSHFKTFKKDAYDKTLGFGEYGRSTDKDLVLKLEEVTKLHFVEQPLYYYRTGIPTQLTRNPKTPSREKEIIAAAKQRRQK